ncbi:hypothetical protein [Clostridium perfringens]|uniref:hypothetical protein n=1 Tax=Clostridium perfringens TaxID=1502 RepID=UPI001FA9360F|nr:hypothetical protein [Clostridium perfringens]
MIYENGVYNISGEKEAGRIIMDYMLPNIALWHLLGIVESSGTYLFLRILMILIESLFG